MSDTVTQLSAGKRLWESGNFGEAERRWRSVLAAEPGHAQAARLLGEFLVDSRRYREAHEVVAPAARRHPFDGELRILMGRCEHGLGRIPAARSIFESVAAADPKSLSARVGLALCAAASRRPADAVAMLQPLLAANPSSAQIHGALAQAYFALGRPDEAVTHYRAALQQRSALGWRAELGWSLYLAKRVDESLVEFDAVLKHEPGSHVALSGKARSLIEKRDEDGARIVLEKALEQGSTDSSVLIAHARLAKTPEQRAAAKQSLERCLTIPRSQSDRVLALFGLGMLKEKDGDYDGAFSAYREGNASSGPSKPAAEVRRSFDDISAILGSQRLQIGPRSRNMDAGPVFIVGMPRSGTSLIEQILASHPEVYGAGELHTMHELALEMPRLMRPQSPQGFPGCLTSATAADFEAVGAEYLKRTRAQAGAARFITDKMPWNFVHCGLINLCLPGAKIIHCLRDPRDTCFSIYATALGQTHNYKYQLKELAAVYRLYRGLMDHWRGALTVPMLEVRYEDVVADPETHARRIVDFAGLPWDDRCLKFYENKRAIGTASADQVRRPIYNNSVGRWKHFERHLGDLTQGLQGLE